MITHLTMNDQQLRNYVAGLYPGRAWKERVNRMSDAQVFAIYKAKEEYNKNKRTNKKKGNL